MAFETGSTTGASDLLSKLSTFAAANGWTIDDAVASDKFALSKNSMFVSFRYDSSDTTGTQIVSVHQATGHTPAALPGDHVGDSGSGYNATSSVSGVLLDNERYVDLGLSANELPSTYYFFEQDASPAYIHVVIAKEDGQHRHFGFGELEDFGTWSGGEYCYGHHVVQASTVLIYSETNHCCLLDGRFDGGGSAANPEHFPTMRITSFLTQPVGSVWGEIKGAFAPDDALDTAGNTRLEIQGGYRGGPIMRAFGNIAVNKSSGLINFMPLPVWAYFPGTPDKIYFLGEHPDVRAVILDGIAPGEEISIGAETWVCFPSVEKSGESGAGLTLYQGIAYRKEVA